MDYQSNDDEHQFMGPSWVKYVHPLLELCALIG